MWRSGAVALARVVVSLGALLTPPGSRKSRITGLQRGCALSCAAAHHIARCRRRDVKWARVVVTLRRASDRVGAHMLLEWIAAPRRSAGNEWVHSLVT